METSLRPLTLGELLDRTAQLYRENFLLFAGIAAVYTGMLLIFSLLQIAVQELLRANGTLHQLQWVVWSLSGVTMIVAFILSGATVAANNRAVGWLHLGQPATIRGAYTSILPQLGRYLWLMTITAVMVWLPIALLYAGYLVMLLVYAKPHGLMGRTGTAAVPVEAHAMGIFIGASIVFLLLMIPAGVYTVLMALRYSLAIPACVVENLKARPAIRRSIALSKGSKGRIFLLFLLVVAVNVGLLFLTQIVFLVMSVQHHGILPAWIRAVQQVVAFFTDTFVAPILAIGLTLFYYDQRVRQEGFDIEWMMQAAGMAPPAAPEAASLQVRDVGGEANPEEGSGSVHE
ncbi:MAG TPA: hypothetical protein VMV57_11235 [Terracidiphilus sp.]|nr:hypothetical protein [Terracidiphilus sp.]